MTDEKLNQLANLIDELSGYIGCRSVGIVNGVIQDGYHVFVFDNKTGERIESLDTTHVFLPDAVKALMQKKIPNPL